MNLLRRILPWLLALLLAVVCVGAFCLIFLLMPYLMIANSKSLIGAQMPWPTSIYFVVISIWAAIFFGITLFVLIRMRKVFLLAIPSFLLLGAFMTITFLYLFTPFFDFVALHISIPKACWFLTEIDKIRTKPLDPANKQKIETFCEIGKEL